MSMWKSGSLVMLLLLTACTLDKAVYFKANKGTISVAGPTVTVSGEGLEYHSVPCGLTECATPNHPKP